MRCWTEHQIEFSGVFEIKLSTTALALLLASGRPELASIMVSLELALTMTIMHVAQCRRWLLR